MCVPVSAVNNYGAIVVFKVKENSFASLFDLRFLAGRKFRLDLFSFVETLSLTRPLAQELIYGFCGVDLNLLIVVAVQQQQI